MSLKYWPFKSSSDCGRFCLSMLYSDINLRSVNKFCRKTASCACLIEVLKFGTAIETRIAMMLITMISSINVKPRLWFVLEFGFIYQSLYLVPSSAVPCDFVYTSNRLSPLHESESGSSCMERIPHSVFPVIGSIGIRRRNFSFFPFTSSPSTSFCRSGGQHSEPTLLRNAALSQASL